MDSGPNKTRIGCNVHFVVPQTVDVKGKAVARFRSLATTKLFFHNFSAFCQHNTDPLEVKNKLQFIRSKVNVLIHQVNVHGGWNLIGWYKAGGVGDAGNSSSAERVVNTLVTMHVSYLQPYCSVEEWPTQDALGFNGMKISSRFEN